MAYGTGYPTYYPSEYEYELTLAQIAYDDGWDDVMYGDVNWRLYRWDDDYADGVDDADYHLYKKRSAAYSYYPSYPAT